MPATKNISISMEMDVAFHDVDSCRIVWHGNYPKYLEIARCKLLSLIGMPYQTMENEGYFFPIIDMRLKYIQPLVFEQRFTITATLVEWRNKLTIEYVIHDAKSGDKMLRAHTSQVAVKMPEGVTQYEAPKSLLDKIESLMQRTATL